MFLENVYYRMPFDEFGNTAALTVAAAVSIGAAGYYWSRAKPTPNVAAIVDLRAQTRILPDGSRVASCQKGDVLLPRYYDDVSTISDAVRRGMRESPDGRMLGYRKKLPDGTAPYHWLSYKEVVDRSIDIAYGLREIGVEPGQKTFIGILAKNRPEWIICEHAAYNNNNVLVPLYETLGPNAATYIINHTGMETVIVDEEVKAENVLGRKDECRSIKTIVIMESFSKALREHSERAGMKVYSLAEIEAKGHSATDRLSLQLPSADDLCTIAYTSGTTGKPKGVMLTHGNVIACITGLFYIKHASFAKDDVMFSFLPLAHMFERLMETAAFMVGMRVGYYGGNIKTVVDDIKELKPTVLPLVPRVLNRIYDKVMAEVNKCFFTKMVFNMALSMKLSYVKSGIIRNDTLVDRLFFKAIRDTIGGRVNLIITGSAPAAANVLDFARATMGCVVLEGYGQTECVAECALGVEADFSTGCVGIPVPCNAIKLVDVPELGYRAKDMMGEVCVRGYNVFKGYYKDEALTKETLEPDGWLHTGDIGRWTPVGTLQIIDRKKNIFKLSQGEYVAPEKIEAVYGRSKYVAQVFVYGESLRTCLIGVVVPEEEVLKELAETLHLQNRSFAELCRDRVVKKVILADMIDVGKQEGLCSFEQVKDIYVCSEPFSIENGLLTPTLKSKRIKLQQRFASQLSQIVLQRWNLEVRPIFF
uniref:Long-chain-fatty-acid--CoA ligase n=1 Tax=Parascaris univalens TaxID=6257 RepID=A0A914ZN71_PARUN